MPPLDEELTDNNLEQAADDAVDNGDLEVLVEEPSNNATKPKKSSKAKVAEAPAVEIADVLPAIREKKIMQGLLSCFVLDENNRDIQQDKVVEYAKTIPSRGINKPLKCRKIQTDDDSIKYMVIDGAHRILAARLAEKQGHSVGYIPFIVDNNSTEEARSFDRLILNTSAAMSAYDEAREFKRLMDKGYTIADISKNSGKTVTHINLMLPLADAPKKIRDMIGNSNISPTLAAQLFAKHNDWDALSTYLSDILDIKISSNKTGKLGQKITQKDIDTLPLDPKNAEKKISRNVKAITKYSEAIRADTEMDRAMKQAKLKLATQLQKLQELIETDIEKAAMQLEKLIAGKK